MSNCFSFTLAHGAGATNPHPSIMSEHTKYASAEASAGKSSRTEYSGAAIGGALVFGAIVGLAGVGVEHLSSSAFAGASIRLGLKSIRSTTKNVDFDTDTFEFNNCLEGDYTPTDPAYASWSSDGSAARKLDSMKLETLFDPIGTFKDESGELAYNAQVNDESFCLTDLWLLIVVVTQACLPWGWWRYPFFFFLFFDRQRRFFFFLLAKEKYPSFFTFLVFPQRTKQSQSSLRAGNAVKYYDKEYAFHDADGVSQLTRNQLFHTQH